MSVFGTIYYTLKNKLAVERERRFRDNVIKSMIQFYSTNDQKEISDAVAYYKKGGVSPFPYNLEAELENVKVAVEYTNDFPYINHQGKKLFFPKQYSAPQVERLYKGLMAEQLEKSPHRYTQGNFSIEENSTLVDVGSAEAMFSLENIEKLNQLFLFELDEKWHEPLAMTFEPWKDKVTMVPMGVSDENIENKLCTLDKYLENKINEGTSVFIKMDVEGYEERVFAGMKNLLKKSDLDIKVSVATYHNQEDFNRFEKHLSDFGFDTQGTSGFILFYYDRNIEQPYLRRCILQAKKAKRVE